MSNVFPIKTETQTDEDREPFLLDLRNEEADRVFSALSSSTSREILTVLYEDPHAASELALELDTTLQNIQYHLRNLKDAELIEVVDTWYSERGNEMKVYAPSGGAMVLFAGSDSSENLRHQLKKLFGGGLLLGISMIILRGLTVFISSESGDMPEEDVDQTVIEGLLPEWFPFMLEAFILVIFGGLIVLVILLVWQSQSNA